MKNLIHARDVLYLLHFYSLAQNKTYGSILIYCYFVRVKNGELMYLRCEKRRLPTFKNHYTLNTSIASSKQYYSVAKAFRKFHIKKFIFNFRSILLLQIGTFTEGNYCVYCARLQELLVDWYVRFWF